MNKIFIFSFMLALDRGVYNNKYVIWYANVTHRIRCNSVYVLNIFSFLYINHNQFFSKEI